MKYAMLTLILILGFTLCLAVKVDTTFDYNKAWKEIDKLENDQMVKSMLEKLELVYQAAVKDENGEQQIKALIYQMSAQSQIEDGTDQKIIDLVRNNIRNASYPASAILHSLLAEMYWDYYQNNYYASSQRTETVNFNQAEIDTWDLKTIAKAALNEFKLSLQNPAELQKYPFDFYPGLIQRGGTPGWNLRPTLYDLLAHRALGRYDADYNGISVLFDTFKLSDAALLAPARDFVNLQIAPVDTLSGKYLSLKLYQDLIRFHLNDKDPEVLVVADLERLNYVKRFAAFYNADAAYEAALTQGEKLYQGKSVSTQYTFNRAAWIQKKTTYKDPVTGEESKGQNNRIALEMCNQAITAFPESFGGQSCNELKKLILDSELDITMESVVIPGKPIKLMFKTRNIAKLNLRVYKLPTLKENYAYNGYDNIYRWQEDDRLKKLLLKKPVYSTVYSIPNEGDYNSHSFENALEQLPIGHYLLIGSDDFSRDLNEQHLKLLEFTSSNLEVISPLNAGSVLMVCHRSTGKAIAEAKVAAYEFKWNDNGAKGVNKSYWSGYTDKEGKATIPAIQDRYNTFLVISMGADSLVVNNQQMYYNNHYHKPEETRRILLFTDRSIYRPGQTIYCKGIVYDSDGERQNKLKPNEKVSLTLYDVNYKQIDSQTLTTNEFGSVSYSFTAPKGVLTGRMQIVAASGYRGSGSVAFNVEEYKRPKFEVKIEKPKDTYRLGQSVTVTGKAMAYAGYPIDGAKLTYTVKRHLRYAYYCWWWFYPTTNEDLVVGQGSMDTGKQGEFSITFMAEKDESKTVYEGYYYSYEISATVTDINGETQSGVTELNIGEKELILDPVISKFVRQASRPLAIPLVTTNLNGDPVSASGKITISRLQTPDHIQKRRNPGQYYIDNPADTPPDRNMLSRADFLKILPNDPYGSENQVNTWKVDKQVYKGDFNTGKNDTLRITSFRKWKAGMYRLEAVSTYNGREVKVYRYFTLYTPKSGDLPYVTADLFIPAKTTCEPGQTAEILVGTSYSDVTVRYEVEKNHQIVDSLTFVLSNKQRLFRIPVLESDRGSFYVHVSYVKDNRVYLHSQEIAVSWRNKKLNIEYSTFRDKLLPGQKEEWRLKLKDYKGGAVSAEVLASMYDASLDALMAHQWYANIYNSTRMSFGWKELSNTDLVSGNGFHYSYYPGYLTMQFSTLAYFGKDISWNRRYGWGRGMMAMPSGAGGKGMYKVDVTASGSLKEVSMDSMADVSTESIAPAADKPKPAVDLSGVSARSNFAETAFFYPSLRTDEAGDVSIAFTVPESLTKWKFQALALTRELQIGLGEKSIVTQKPLMVIPNLPRFFREGDRISISTKISAPGDTDQSGQCQLYLFDAISLKPVDKELGLTSAQKTFSIKKGESTVVEWSLNIPFGISAVTCKIVAKAGNFSDGEENTIPVLTNRMLVTESMPLPVRGNKSRSFVFEKLKQSTKSTTLKNHKLTLEYTSNPAWYAVQALPYMMEYPHSCNEQIFTRFYANSLAGHIANSNPRLQRVFKAWKESPNPSALLSNLEKNQELKSVILQETPWVLDAQDESQSKQRLGLLFDLNTMKDKAESTLLLLKKNQSSSGGWPWFTGMQDSWWVTQYIVEGLAHLQHLEVAPVLPDEQSDMLNKAVQYLDGQILIDYQNILKWGHKDDDHLGYMEMHYLYTRSFFPEIEMNSKVKEAVDYFRGQAAKYWQNKGLYSQALIALAEYRSGNKTLPRLLMKSIKERSIENEELGMYWKENSSSWYWYQAPIETQALLIEAFSDITQDTEAVDGQRTWLLKQKQTTNWKTTKATAEACYALLLSGTEWLNTDKLATITIGGKEINPEKLEGTSLEAGTGYFKTSWSGDEISANQADVTVVNPNPVPAWGSLYWQYFEDLDKITPAETPLKLKKQLFLERTTDNGTVLDPISDKAQLKVGDKVIVRIELRSDRDMEYVHMKDMRSAGFEPLNVISHYKWQDGLGYYEATGDAATNFFIEYLAKGTYVFEYPLRVSNKGDFSNGVTTIQCMYAPEFTSHSEGIRVEVK